MARKTKNTNLKLVQTSEQREVPDWDAAEKSWKITPREVKQRIIVLREELETYRQQLEGVPFDIASAVHFQIEELIQHRKAVLFCEVLNHLAQAFYARIEFFDEVDGVFSARIAKRRWSIEITAEAGFKIGVLAGVILAGCPKEQVDRFERGLIFAITCDKRIVKSEDEL